MTDSVQTGVLFVCLGNICRSPLAEGVFLHLARERGVADLYRVDSCGTGSWHVGKPADPRSVMVAAKHGIELPSIGRQWDPSRDPRFEYIIPMDRSNERDILNAGAPSDRVRLLRAFDPTLGDDAPLDVPDPYYGGDSGFDLVFDMVHRACEGLLDQTS